MRDFEVVADTANSLTLMIRCQEWVVFCDDIDDLSDDDVAFWEKVADILNQHAKELLPQ